MASLVPRWTKQGVRFSYPYLQRGRFSQKLPSSFGGREVLFSLKAARKKPAPEKARRVG